MPLWYSGHWANSRERQPSDFADESNLNPAVTASHSLTEIRKCCYSA